MKEEIEVMVRAKSALDRLMAFSRYQESHNSMLLLPATRNCLSAAIWGYRMLDSHDINDLIAIGELPDDELKRRIVYLRMLGTGTINTSGNIDSCMRFLVTGELP